jgi:formylglycine-generating enzyme required for sulfatase activity
MLRALIMSHVYLLSVLLSILLTAHKAQAQEGCAADADGDGVVNGNDLAIVLGSWGPCVGCPGDLNANGLVNGEDLAVALTRWGSTCAPTVSSMSATAGPIAGGTAVTITGGNLLNPTSVTFGGTAAAVTLSSRNSLTVVAPPHSEGAATVTVNTAGGAATAGVFTYYGAPTITAVSPNTGAAAGGSAVTITGAAFYGNPTVTFGGVAASGVSVLSPAQLRAVAPPGSVGTTVAISVATPSGATTLREAFAYVPIIVPPWATLLEALPDPSIVTSESLRNAITATGLAWRVRDNGTQIEMVLIPPGTFDMGCSASNWYSCDSDESPVHAMTLTDAFYMGRYEVTQAQWQARIGSNPSYFQSSSAQVPSAQVPNRPVERVSWNMIAGAGGFLSGKGLRLPTEAEWEYACRADTTTAFHGFTGYLSGTNDDTLVGSIAWYNSNSSNQTQPVGGKLANGFGLHDMSGNVWEWVNDWYSSTYYASSPSTNPTGPATGTYRVVRGGVWTNNSNFVRSSRRFYTTPDVTSYDLGFRVARNP